MNALVGASGIGDGTERKEGPSVSDCYEPPSLISLGEFGETTLGKGNVYSDDGTQMF